MQLVGRIHTYNAFTGMLETYEYPSGFKLKYLYDEWGNQHEVRTADAANTLLWKANAENQRGQLTQATMGNGTITDFEWDTYGFPQRNKVSKGTSSILQNLRFNFNSVTGNLDSRTDDKRIISESFGYDNLLKDRLTYWSSTGGTMTYAANGNILKKTDVSTANTGYLYESFRPNAVTNIVSPTSSFQQNAQPQEITYTTTNKVEHVLNNDVLGYQLHLTYGIDDQRVKSFLNKTTGHPSIPEVMKYYLDNYEYEYRNESYRHLHYLQGPDGLFAIMVKQGTSQSMYYVHKDYLGSLTAISDATGNLIESLSYDPWGRRRNPNNWNDYNVTSTLFDRGFTGHEHLPQFGLINMNGRVYDPFLARFLSPDPFVQAPDYSQNFNRYSYAFNNPLKYTDPDGEWVHLVVGAVIGGIVNWAANGAEFNAEGLKYFAVGALAGGLAAGVGAGIGAAIAGNVAAGGGFAAGFMGTAAISSTGFAAGAISGAAAGFTNGLVSGTGNSLIRNENIGQALEKGLNLAYNQGIAGAISGGVFGGIHAANNNRNFWTGAPKTYKIPDTPLLASTNNGIVVSQDGFTVQNNSGETIYYKPETSDPLRGIKGDGAYPIKNGHGIKHAVDGVTAPGKFAQVYKVTNPFSMSSIRVGYSSISIDKPYLIGELTLNEAGGGGWLTTPPDQGWHQIFKMAGYVFK